MALAVGVVALGPLAVLASALLVDLPAALAVTWDADRPDGSVRTAALCVLATLVGVAAVVLVLVALAAPRSPFLAGRAAVSVAAGVSAAAAGTWGLLVVTTAAAADASTPPAPTVEIAIPLFAVLVAVQLAGAAYGSPPHDPAPPPPAADLPRAPLADGETPGWRHAGWSGFYLAGTGGLVLLGALTWRPLPQVAVLCWVVAVLTAPLLRLRFALDERGFALSVALLPAMVIPWDRIVEARPARIRPLQRGGWGFRVIPGRTGIVLRRGPGLVLTLADGRRLGVTLDDPVLPAGLVNAHLDRLRGGAG